MNIFSLAIRRAGDDRTERQGVALRPWAVAQGWWVVGGGAGLRLQALIVIKTFCAQRTSHEGRPARRNHQVPVIGKTNHAGLG